MPAFAAEVTKTNKWQSFSLARLRRNARQSFDIAVCGEQLDENGQNLIRVMAENGRLNALPDVLEQFIHLRAAVRLPRKTSFPHRTLSEQQLATAGVSCCDGLMQRSVTQS